MGPGRWTGHVQHPLSVSTIRHQDEQGGADWDYGWKCQVIRTCNIIDAGGVQRGCVSLLFMSSLFFNWIKFDLTTAYVEITCSINGVEQERSMDLETRSVLV